MTIENSGRRWRFLAAGLTAVLIGTGCAEPGTGPQGLVERETAEALAMFVVDADATAGFAADAIAEQRSGSRQFSRSVACPAGGTRGVNGSGTSALDIETRVLSVTWSTTQTHDECGFTHTRRDRPVTVVMDGSVTVTGAASYQLPETRPGQRSVLSFSSRRVGAMTTVIGDRSRTCEIDVTETFDPASGAFHVSGVVCGREVDVTRTPGGATSG